MSAWTDKAWEDRLASTTTGEPVDPTVIGGAPAGAIMMYGGSAAPAGYLLCDGASLLRASYTALFAAIGTAYGSVDITHFNVPDLRQRFPMGKAASGTGNVLGVTGGTIDHAHDAHAVTQPSAHSAHTVTQPTGHAGLAHANANVNAHAVTQPSNHGTHTHTGASAGTTPKLFTSNTSTGVPGVSGTESAALTHSGTAVANHIVTQADNHPASSLLHTGTDVDAHSAHTGTAVAAHSAVNPPFQTVNFIIKT